MFEIKVYKWSSEQLHRVEYWCHFLTGTHWRKFRDNAEIVILRVDHLDYGRLRCECKSFNNKYSMGGLGTNVVRDFPIGYSTDGEWTDFDSIAKHGFNLVPDSIQTERGYIGRDDEYCNNMNKLDWGDYDLKRPDTDYELKGLTPRGVRNEPIALFNLGIPIGRVVLIKGLVIGNESRPDCSYEKVWQ